MSLISAAMPSPWIPLREGQRFKQRTLDARRDGLGPGIRLARHHQVLEKNLNIKPTLESGPAISSTSS
jgi:hypothetical protein